MIIFVVAIHLVGACFSIAIFRMWQFYRKFMRVRSLLVFSIIYFVFSVLSLAFIGTTALLALILKG